MSHQRVLAPTMAAPGTTARLACFVRTKHSAICQLTAIPMPLSVHEPLATLGPGLAAAVGVLVLFSGRSERQTRGCARGDEARAGGALRRKVVRGPGTLQSAA